MEMTPQALRGLCKKHELYITPHLNDKLYCNLQGFTSLTGLSEYTELKSVFLEGNALSNVDSMPPLPLLKCLFMQQNSLTSLQGLSSTCPSLVTLDVSNNMLASLAGLEGCFELSTLQCADNHLECTEDLSSLTSCTSLQTLDLRRNELADFEGVLLVLKSLPNLKSVYLEGNLFMKSTRNYRKRMLSALRSLTYLDDRPFFDSERDSADAWAARSAGNERNEAAVFQAVPNVIELLPAS